MLANGRSAFGSGTHQRWQGHDSGQFDRMRNAVVRKLATDLNMPASASRSSGRSRSVEPAKRERRGPGHEQGGAGPRRQSIQPPSTAIRANLGMCCNMLLLFPPATLPLYLILIMLHGLVVAPTTRTRAITGLHVPAGRIYCIQASADPHPPIKWRAKSAQDASVLHWPGLASGSLLRLCPIQPCTDRPVDV